MKETRHSHRAGFGLLVCLLTAACSASSQPPGTQTAAGAAPDSQTIRLALDPPVVVDGILRVAGSTDLPDGAILAYQVKHENLESGEFHGLLEGHLAVTGGRFEGNLDVQEWPTGLLDVQIAFQLPLASGTPQPDAVVSRYGSHGEHLAGPNVVTLGEGPDQVRRVVAHGSTRR